MKSRWLSLFALIPSLALAAGTGIAPAPPRTTTVKQTTGTTVQTITFDGTKGIHIVPTPDMKITVSGDDGGPVRVFPNANVLSVTQSGAWPKPCATNPPLVTRQVQCPNNTTGGPWTQTEQFSLQASPLCWQEFSPAQWLPTSPPAGTCQPTTPPPTLQPLLLQTQLLAVAKPARGVPFQTQYGTTETRITDHAIDVPGSSCLRNDYSRREPFNADKSRVIFYQCGGPWVVFKTSPIAFEKVLAGPGGDAEVQWSPTDPDKLYYMDGNGGCCIYELTVSTNTHTTYYNLLPQAQALLGAQADRLWTRSEGSPSDDNRVWSFVAQHYNQSTGNFDTKGYIAFDVVAHQVLWSKVTSDAVDHISTSHSGRYAIGAGDTTWAARLTDGAICTLRDSGEHEDLMVLPGGHDALATIDFSASEGDFIIIDIDQCFADGHPTRRTLSEHIYNNPKFGTDDGNCGHTSGHGSCSFHISGRANQRPGWVFFSNYGVQRLSLFAYDYAADKFYGIGVSMTNTGGYFTETQAAVSRDGKTVMFNDTFSASSPDSAIEVYRIDLP